MRLPDKTPASEIGPKTAMILLAVGINALEYLFPRIPFLPWLKPGLANAITIIWIVRWGAADAVVFTFVKSWITSFYFGFSFVSLSLSLSGGIISAAGMGALWTLLGRRGWMGLAGLGIAGAALHNAGQLFCVYALLSTTAAVWYQAPFMIAASLVFGTVTGLLAHALLPLWGASPIGNDADNAVLPAVRTGRERLRLVSGGVILLACGGIVFVKSLPVLAFAAVLATLLSLGTAEDKKRAALFPLRFWLLFAFIAVTYLFFSYGRSVGAAWFVTYEGIRETGMQWLRLWTWLQLSLALTRLQFNRIALAFALRRISLGRETMLAALYALERFPAFVDLLRRRRRVRVRPFSRNFTSRVAACIESLYLDISALAAAGSEKKGAPR